MYNLNSPALLKQALLKFEEKTPHALGIQKR